MRWWQDQQLAEPPTIPGPNVEALRLRVESTYQEAWDEFARQHGQHLPRELLRLGGRLGEHLPHVLDRLASPPWTLVHGDYQLNNIFYGPDGGIRAVADWQVIVRARGAMDVSHFLVRSLDPASRRAVEARLVDEYHALLIAGGVTDYSRRECWDDYRLAALSQFGLGIVLAYALAAGVPERDEEERIESIAAVVGARLIAALTELRPLEVLEGRRWWSHLRRLLP